MKYSKDDLNNLLYKEYILLIAEELNNNGFTRDNGNKYEVGTDIDGNFVSDFSRGFVLSLKDEKAIEFLKGIGLLNNGRCPLTGLMLSDKTRTTYTSNEAPNISYDINTAWNEYTEIRRNWGCLISIPIIIIGIVIGLINGFDTTAYIVLGVGVGGAILAGVHGTANFGNNWNTLCMSNGIGINTVTLFYILKIFKQERFNGEINSKIIIKTIECGIPCADLIACEEWIRQ